MLRPGVVEMMQRHQVCYPATSATSAVLSPATYEGESYLVLGLTGAAEVIHVCHVVGCHDVDVEAVRGGASKQARSLLFYISL